MFYLILLCGFVLGENTNETQTEITSSGNGNDNETTANPSGGNDNEITTNSSGGNDNDNETNKCGPDCRFTIENDVLLIEGSGKMDNFTEETIPWKNESLVITKIIFKYSQKTQTNNNSTQMKTNTNQKGITMIGSYAFYGLQNLTTIEFTETIITFGEYSFAYCTSLKTITMVKPLRTIGANSFEGCTSLKTIILPETLQTIGDHSFEGCVHLEDVQFYGSKNICNRKYPFIDSTKNVIITVSKFYDDKEFCGLSSIQIRIEKLTTEELVSLIVICCIVGISFVIVIMLGIGRAIWEAYLRNRKRIEQNIKDSFQNLTGSVATGVTSILRMKSTRKGKKDILQNSAYDEESRSYSSDEGSSKIKSLLLSSFAGKKRNETSSENVSNKKKTNQESDSVTYSYTEESSPSESETSREEKSESARSVNINENKEKQPNGSESSSEKSETSSKSEEDE